MTAALCTRCGLCCDGTLFGDVELRGQAEAARLEAIGLDVDTDDADTELLALPCAGLRGTRCSVYAHRPQCCRTFECRLLQEAERGLVQVGDALARVAAVKAQIRRVHVLLDAPATRRAERLPLAERIADALSTPHPPSRTRARRRRAELRAAAAALRRMLDATFLA